MILGRGIAPTYFMLDVHVQKNKIAESSIDYVYNSQRLSESMSIALVFDLYFGILGKRNKKFTIPDWS